MKKACACIAAGIILCCSIGADASNVLTPHASHTAPNSAVDSPYLDLDLGVKSDITTSSSRTLEENDDDHDTDKAWGVTILASCVVNAVTFSGAFTIIPLSRYVAKNYASLPVTAADGTPKGPLHQPFILPVAYDVILSSFSSGAILSTAFMLLFPEALHKIHAGYVKEQGPGFDPHAGHGHRYLEGDDEEEGVEEIPVDAVWKWGACIMAGYLLSYLIDFVGSSLCSNYGNNAVDLVGEKKSIEDAKANLSSDNAITIAPAIQLTHRERRRLIGGILVGDFFHNFVDGIFIAIAFKSCSNAFGWSIVVATVIHELPQEISDFYLLTTFCQLSNKLALFLNFLSGLSVLIGGIFVLSFDPSDTLVGAILALGGGVYIQIGASEAMPKASEACQTAFHQFLMLAMFCLGATLIGLVLLDHKHCEVGGDEHDDRRF